MWFLFDIGGTKMRFGVSTDRETLGRTEIFDTPPTFAEARDLFAKMFTNLTAGAKVKACAGGVPGRLNLAKSTLLNSIHLSDWVGKSLQTEFEQITACPVKLENDAALVGLGEVHYGAGRGKEIVVYLTISTGIGGVKIAHGRIDENVAGFEPGKQILDLEHNLSLEDYVSGRAVESRFKMAPKEITDPAVWNKLARFLAYGLHNIILEWSPELIILGGSMMKVPGIKVEDVLTHLRLLAKSSPQLPAIVKAELGDWGGLYGALAFLKQTNVF